MTTQRFLYHRHRFPAEIISYAVWLYHLFSLSLRDVELILAECGVVVTRESIRHWCRKFGAAFTKRLRHRRSRPGDTWHLADVFIRLNAVLHDESGRCKGFKSSDQAQGFLSAHGIIYGHFQPRRHRMTARDYRRARAKAFRIWRQETCVHQAK